MDRTKRASHEGSCGANLSRHDNRTARFEIAAGILAGLVRDTKKIAIFREPIYLKVGSDLLVYAWRVGSEYITGICGSHKLAKDAKDYEALAAGVDPRKEKPALRRNLWRSAF